MAFLDTINSPQSNRVLKILILVAILLFIAAILIFWFGGSSFSERSVTLQLEGPERAFSGDEVTYTVTYSNNTRTDLQDLKFRFVYPENSIVIDAEGNFSENTTVTFEIEKLDAGKSETKEFKAFLVGDKGSVLYGKVDMTYRAGGINSSFEKKPITVATTIIGMPVPLTLSAPPTAVAGQEITYTLDYRNETENDISDLRFRFAYPEGFTPKRFTPQPSEGNTTWNVATLRKGSGARISITGTITGNERDNRTVVMTLQRKVNNTYINYEKAEAATLISSPLLNVRTVVNGSRDFTASPGEFLTYTITYRNNSTYTFSGLNLLAALEGEMYDLTTLDPAGGFFDDSRKTIIWNSGSVPKFSSLGPQQGGNIEFRVRLKSGFSGTLGSKNFFVKTTATLITQDIPTGLDADEVSTQDSLITKISTEPTISQRMYYQHVSFGSSGPMPPVVGQKTKFTVTWQITNPGNTVNNAVVKATLPSGISWENVTTTLSNLPLPTFDQNKSQVIWNLGNIPYGTGVTGEKYEASFQISITPSATQRGQSPTLMRLGTFSGTDSFTQQNIVINLDDLTTGDTVDRSGEGTVQ